MSGLMCICFPYSYLYKLKAEGWLYSSSSFGGDVRSFWGGREGVIGPSHSIYIVNSAFFSDPSDMLTRWVRVIKVGTTSLIGVQWGYIKGKLPWPYSRRDECQSSSLGNYYEYDHEEPPYQIERSEWCGNDQGSAERETFSVEEFESHFKTIASHLSKGSEEEE